jgi:hypothetical protein
LDEIIAFLNAIQFPV